jgi:hypothetical protein
MGANALPEDVDPGIRGLCEAMNGLEGVETIASCQGHEGDPVFHTAFVSFHCPNGRSLETLRAAAAVSASAICCIPGTGPDGGRTHWFALCMPGRSSVEAMAAALSVSGSGGTR